MTRLWLIALFASMPLMAEVICALGPGAGAYQAKSDQRPSPDAMQIATRVNAAAKAVCSDHCPELAIFRNATAANVMLLLESGQGKLVYSPQFFGTVDGQYGDAGLMALLAHELGHGLDATMGAAWVNQKWPAEVRADSWAGCVVARLNLKDAEIAAALAVLEKYPPPAHPMWAQRLPAFRTGFGRCGGDAAKLDKKR